VDKSVVELMKLLLLETNDPTGLTFIDKLERFVNPLPEVERTNRGITVTCVDDLPQWLYGLYGPEVERGIRLMYYGAYGKETDPKSWYGRFIIWLAKRYAIYHHDRINQVRRYTGGPYWKHPEEVALIIARRGGSAEQIAAAWLHDVVEDTEATMDSVYRWFGWTIGHMVEGLTDVSRPEDGNRAIRKAIDRHHLSQQIDKVKRIKLVDLECNARGIFKHDPDFGVKYASEMELCVPLLASADEELAGHILGLIAEFRKRRFGSEEEQ